MGGSVAAEGGRDVALGLLAALLLLAVDLPLLTGGSSFDLLLPAAPASFCFMLFNILPPDGLPVLCWCPGVSRP